MPYIVKQDIIDRFGSDELPELSGGGDDDVKINAAIADAEGQINLNFRTGGYSVPLRGQAVQEIKRNAARLVRYLLAEDTNRMSKEVKERYDEVRAWLKSASKGEVVLTCDDTSPRLTSVPVRRT